jgi:hypothetical protein
LANANISPNPLGALPEIVLVHCMVDCDQSQLWKFYGTPMEIIDFLFKLVVGSGIASSISNANVESPQSWQALRIVLPAIHIGVHPDFGVSVSGYKLEDGIGINGTVTSRHSEMVTLYNPE